MRSLSSNLYCAAHIGDHSHKMPLYFQPNKSDTIKSYKQDEALIKTHSGHRIKFSHSDQGGEFLSKEIKSYQDSKGTVCELTIHDSPPQNGVSEHGMQTQAELTRALLIASGLPRFLWEEAMKHVAWIKNRSPHSTLNGKSLYEIKHKKVPHLGDIHEFGTAVHVKDLKARDSPSLSQTPSLHTHNASMWCHKSILSSPPKLACSQNLQPQCSYSNNQFTPVEYP